MNIRALIILSLLVGIGTVLHQVVPPIMGMTPDLLLAMMFLGILLFPRLQYVVLLSAVTAFLAALTTKFPMGEIASIIEKPFAAFSFFGLYLLVRHLLNSKVTSLVLTAIGTLISGTIFLTVALVILKVDVTGGFLALLGTVVLPTTLINTIIMAIVYPIVETIMKRANPIPT